MKKHKAQVVMARLVPLNKCDGLFDLEFWRRVGVQGRFAAAWQMVCDLYKWNPRYEKQQGLQRTVAVLKPRKG